MPLMNLFMRGLHNDFKRLNGRSLEAILVMGTKSFFLNKVITICSCHFKLSFAIVFIKPVYTAFHTIISNQ